MATGKTIDRGGAKPKRSRRMPARESYLALVREHPLRTIRDEGELDRAIAMVDRLLNMAKRDAGQEEYLDVLGTLIHEFESEHYPHKRVSDAEMLTYLMEARGINQADVVKGTGIDQTTMSLVLNGKRNLTRAHIETLAQFFHVDAGVFFDRA